MLQHKRLALFLALTLLVLAVMPVFAQDAAPVEMWIAFTDSRLDWTQQKAAEFHTQFPDLPQIDVVGKADYDTLVADTQTAAQQGALPAIVQYPDYATQSALDSLNFTTITDAVGRQTAINGVPVALNDIVAPIKAYYTVKRKLVSMPWDVTSTILFSNQNMLQSAGISAPPKTWADVEADCAAIMSANNPPAYCFTWPNHGWFFEQWLAQQNALFANNGNGRTNRATEVVFNNDAAVATLSWLADMKNKGYLYYTGAQGDYAYSTVDQAFESQQVAMAIQTSADATSYTNAGQQNGFTVEASNMPYNQDTGWTGNFIGGGSLWLADGLDSATQDAALTWLFWLTNSDNTADWHKNTGDMPIRQSAITALTNAGWFNDNPNLLVATQQIAKSKSTPASSGPLLGNFPAVRDSITGAIDKMLQSSGGDPKALLDDAADSANRTLNEYNALNAS